MNKEKTELVVFQQIINEWNKFLISASVRPRYLYMFVRVLTSPAALNISREILKSSLKSETNIFWFKIL